MLEELQEGCAADLSRHMPDEVALVPEVGLDHAVRVSQAERLANTPSLKEIAMRWNEHALRRAETVIVAVVIALILLAYLVSKLI
jgi:hypothetical protein